MFLYKLKFTVLQLELIRLLCMKAGTPLNQRQLATLLNVSPTAIAKSLPLLEKESIATITRGTTKLNFVQLNKTPTTAELKRVINYTLLQESGLPNYLKENYPHSIIMHHGAYAQGADTTTTPISITIINSQEKPLNLTPYEKKLERTITLKYSETLPTTPLSNSITLQGGTNDEH